MIEITMPDYDDMLDALRCIECDCEMASLTTTNVYKHKGHDVRVSNIRAHKCLECGMELYSSAVVDLVLYAIRNAVEKECRDE